MHWFLPWAGNLHVEAPVCSSECFWSCYICVWDCTKEIQFQLGTLTQRRPKHVLLFTESFWCSGDELCFWEDMDCVFTLCPGYKKMHENKIHQDTPGRIPSPYQWPFPLIPSVTSEHLTSFPASRQGILIRSLLITYLLTNYTSVDTKILPLWLQAPFGKRVNKS